MSATLIARSDASVQRGDEPLVVPNHLAHDFPARDHKREGFFVGHIGMTIGSKAADRNRDVERVHLPARQQVDARLLGQRKRAEVEAEGDFVTPHLDRHLAVNRRDRHQGAATSVLAPVKRTVTVAVIRSSIGTLRS
jgi:hypothetical protein